MGKIQIEKGEIRTHKKASEKYIDVVFTYEDGYKWDGSIPIEYRRTGTDLLADEEIENHLQDAYKHCHPSKWAGWRKLQNRFWQQKPNADVTKKLFDKMASTFQWTCTACALPSNPNWARRAQDIKEFGFTFATNTAMFCKKCKMNRTHLVLVPLPRGGISGYETWSEELRNKIIKSLDSYDVFEARKSPPHGLLPDHKFPEIRWDANTRRVSLEHLTDVQIRADFQLLSNQRNQQKREICRKCSQDGNRGFPFGIKYFYRGAENWPSGVPRKGKNAEQGCVGCGWYDLNEWRKRLNQIASGS